MRKTLIKHFVGVTSINATLSQLIVITFLIPLLIALAAMGDTTSTIVVLLLSLALYFFPLKVDKFQDWTFMRAAPILYSYMWFMGVTWGCQFGGVPETLFWNNYVMIGILVLLVWVGMNFPLSYWYFFPLSDKEKEEYMKELDSKNNN